MFVAHHLTTVDKVFAHKLAQSSAPGASAHTCSLSQLIPQVRQLGKQALNEHLTMKKEHLCDQLIAAEGFECVADDEAAGARQAVTCMLHHLKQVAFVWRDILPTNTYCKAVG